MSQPAFMDVPLHIDDEKIQGGFAVFDVALADQDLRGVVVYLTAMGEACADQAAQAASDGGVRNVAGAGDGFQGGEYVLIGFDAGDEARAGGGAGGLK